ncbi:MAG TPA: hypothetical protein VKQ32_10175 [Polyangia bacterium]|nr:hypothetical protein [Polyangia bacterium]
MSVSNIRSFGVVLIALSGVGLASDVLANGGPVDWTEAGARGGLVPKQQTTVRLRSEDLTIAIDPDGKHYDVSAKYLLSNAGDETTIRYGVPLLWGEDPKSPRRAADAVRIKVGDTDNRCTLIKESVALDPSKYDQMDGAPTGGWCVARLTIPKGDAVPLVLTYRADLLFTDADYSKSAFVSYGARLLRYTFFPAGFWVGPAERVSFTVDLGRYAGTERTTAPPGAVKQGSTLAWAFTSVDLKKVPDLEIKLDVEPIAYIGELAKYRKDSKVVMTAKTAKAAGDAAAANRAVDGDPETAWCVDKPGPERWIEVTQRKIDRAYLSCYPEGLFLVSSTTEKTARIKRVRLESCGGRGHDGKPAMVELPVAQIGARGPWGVMLSSDLYSLLPQADQKAFVDDYENVQARVGKCVRLSIVEVEGSGPACIGELMPIRNCG